MRHVDHWGCLSQRCHSDLHSILHSLPTLLHWGWGSSSPPWTWVDLCNCFKQQSSICVTLEAGTQRIFSSACLFLHSSGYFSLWKSLLCCEKPRLQRGCMQALSKRLCYQWGDRSQPASFLWMKALADDSYCWLLGHADLQWLPLKL